MDDDFIEAQREMNREAFGFAHGYVQGLVVVGYAAMFFLWDKVEVRLPAALWSGVGLLLCISVGTYLAWEVFGFLFRQRVLMRQAFAAGKPGEDVDPDAFQAAMKRNLDDLKNLLRSLVPSDVWDRSSGGSSVGGRAGGICGGFAPRNLRCGVTNGHLYGGPYADFLGGHKKKNP